MLALDLFADTDTSSVSTQLLALPHSFLATGKSGFYRVPDGAIVLVTVPRVECPFKLLGHGVSKQECDARFVSSGDDETGVLRSEAKRQRRGKKLPSQHGVALDVQLR
jgi:hypothetical protein